MVAFSDQHITRVSSIEHLLAASNVPAPQPLAVALDAYQAAFQDTEPLDVERECLTIKPDDVPDLVARVTERAVMRAAVGPERGYIAGLLGRRAVAAFQPIAPAVFEKLGTRFTATVPVFLEAFADLPVHLDLDTIARQRSGLLGRYEVALDAARTLDEVAALRERLADLGYRARLHDMIDRRTRFARFDDPDAFRDGRDLGKQPPFGLWAILARAPEITIEWRTLEQQLETVALVVPAEKVGA